ncbi:MAG: dihydrodipicolinate synthase family protein [Candidatus Caldarchaeum sp.]|nr:dihydrodipicolinate synthase family protein [Candidatus Caldarchaeum sp.]
MASVYPEIASGIYRSVKNGNLEEAFRLQQVFNKVREAVKKIGPDTALARHVLKLRGIDIGDPIPPTRTLTNQEKETLAQLLPQTQQAKTTR